MLLEFCGGKRKKILTCGKSIATSWYEFTYPNAYQRGKEVIKSVYVYRVCATGFGRNSTLGRIVDYLSFYIFASWRALLLPKMDICVSLTTPPFIAIIGLMLRSLKGTQMVLWTMDLYPEVTVALGVLREKSFLCHLPKDHQLR